MFGLKIGILTQINVLLNVTDFRLTSLSKNEIN